MADAYVTGSSIYTAKMILDKGEIVCDAYDHTAIFNQNLGKNIQSTSPVFTHEYTFTREIFCAQMIPDASGSSPSYGYELDAIPTYPSLIYAITPISNGNTTVSYKSKTGSTETRTFGVHVTLSEDHYKLQFYVSIDLQNAASLYTVPIPSIFIAVYYNDNNITMTE